MDNPTASSSVTPEASDPASRQAPDRDADAASQALESTLTLAEELAPQAAGATAETLADADPDAMVHPGLPWRADPLGTRRILAPSPCHDATWVIDLHDGVQLWRAFTKLDFFDLEEVPAEIFGRYADHGEAARQADQADFQIFRRLAGKAGRRAELSGGRGYDDAAFGGDSRPFSLAASFFRASTKALKKNANGSWDLAFNIQGDVPRWLLDAPLGELTEVGVLGLGQANDPEGAEARKRIEDAQRRSTLRPMEAEFQEWLLARYDRWGLLRDAAAKNSGALEEAAAETIRRLVGVPTRADFRTNIDAVRAFEALDREYYFDICVAKGIWTPRR